MQFHYKIYILQAKNSQQSVSNNHNIPSEAPRGGASSFKLSQTLESAHPSYMPPERGPLVHHCPPGCCSSREETVSKAMAFLEQSLLRAPPIPALNKWTKVHPVIAQAFVMSSWCGLLPSVFGTMAHATSRRKTRRPRTLDDNSESDISENAQLGAPRDAQHAFQKVASKRKTKMMSFICNKDTQWTLALWMALAMPMLSLHFRLFATATWYSERKNKHGNNASNVRDFLDPARSRANEAVKTISGMLIDAANSPAWFIFHMFLRPLLRTGPHMS